MPRHMGNGKSFHLEIFTATICMAIQTVAALQELRSAMIDDNYIGLNICAIYINCKSRSIRI